MQESMAEEVDRQGVVLDGGWAMNEIRRLLSFKEAARYCGLPRSTFKARCPVTPVKIDDRAHPKIDIKDLDNWIDSIKSGGNKELSDDEIAESL